MTQDWKEQLQKAVGQTRGESSQARPPGSHNIAGGTKPQFRADRREERRPPPRQSRLPQGYLQKGILDPANKQPWPEVICDWPRQIAKCLSEVDDRMTMAQIRKFHGEMLRIKQKLEATKDFETARSEIRSMCQFAHDSVKKRKAPSEFEEFIQKNVEEACKSPDHFLNGFVVHFQGVVAFFPQDRRK